MNVKKDVSANHGRTTTPPRSLKSTDRFYGFLTFDETIPTFKIIKREVKDTYHPKAKFLTLHTMTEHYSQFRRAIEAVSEWFAISIADVNDYAEEIEADASALASLATLRRESQTSSSKAKQKRDAQPQK